MAEDLITEVLDEELDGRESFDELVAVAEADETDEVEDATDEANEADEAEDEADEAEDEADEDDAE